MGVVVAFPGQPLVAVLSEPGRHSVMLAKIGAKDASLQVSFQTLTEAVAEALAGADLCGWRYVGIFDEARLRRIVEIEERGVRSSAGTMEPGTA